MSRIFSLKLNADVLFSDLTTVEGALDVGMSMDRK